MNIQYGKGSTKYGPGVSVELTGDEVAIAIDAWLVAHGVHVSGPRTITVNGELCERGQIYVDPSGLVITPEGQKLSGSYGANDEAQPPRWRRPETETLPQSLGVIEVGCSAWFGSVSWRRLQLEMKLMVPPC